MSQSCRHDVFDPTSTIRLRSDSEGVFVRCAECNKAQHWTADYDDDTEPTAGPTAVERAVCPHGSLRRQCEVCERDEEIARLAKKLRIAELKASGTLATNLCPDHHDKQLGKPCLACEIERLNKWADGFADRQLEERRTAEAYQRELRAEIDRLRAELKAATESEYAFCVERDQLRAEVGKLRAAVCVLCERDGGVCAMGTHEADDDPCTPENCSTMRAVRLAAAEREALERPLELGRATRNWNYRVLCRRDNDGEPYFAVHEVYYDAEGKPTSWTCDAASPAGENALELAVDAARMAAACGLPVLAAAADNTLHQYPDCGCERCGKKQAGSAPAGAKEAREALERAASAAESADPLASKDHDLARQAAEETAAEVRAEVARLQARIDALMLEYCPGEMTPEQTAEWARHQVPHQLTAEDREALEHAPAAEETPASQQWPCINWPCQLPSGHQGPSVSSAESEAAR